MNLKTGEFLVKLARKTIELWVRERKELKPENYPKILGEKRGVFVTLHTYPERDLRGCIGYPYPEMPLIKAVVGSAISAAQDPRFFELSKDELDKIIIEVSVLTKPGIVKVKDSEEYLKKIKIGKDGLIIKNGFRSGLLLPQVPIEYDWNAKTFLENLCHKAGLPQDAWAYKGTEIYKFQSEIFAEKKPNGNVEKTEI